MSDPQQAEPLDNEVDERRVADYLRRHPEFFNQHQELLETLRIPHPCGPAVSLIQRQLEVLREQNTRLRRRLVELIEVARRNDHINERMQRLALGLMEPAGLDERITLVKSLLRDEFQADFTVLRLLARPRSEAGRTEDFVGAEAMEMFANLFVSGRPRCGPVTEAQLEGLFGNIAPEVGSVALVPLCGDGWRGLLAVGSRDEGRFHRGMGTLFLGRMGALVTQALAPHLAPP